MRNKIKKIILFILIIGLLLFMTKLSIGLLNNLFYLGMVCFLIGGVLFLIKKKVFSRVFRSFKLFKVKTSKVDEYVEETTEKFPSDTSTNKSSPFVNWLLGGGIMLITVTMISAFIFY